MGWTFYIYTGLHAGQPARVDFTMIQQIFAKNVRILAKIASLIQSNAPNVWVHHKHLTWILKIHNVILSVHQGLSHQTKLCSVKVAPLIAKNVRILLRPAQFVIKHSFYSHLNVSLNVQTLRYLITTLQLNNVRIVKHLARLAVVWEITVLHVSLSQEYTIYMKASVWRLAQRLIYPISWTLVRRKVSLHINFFLSLSVVHCLSYV